MGASSKGQVWGAVALGGVSPLLWMYLQVCISGIGERRLSWLSGSAQFCFALSSFVPSTITIRFFGDSLGGKEPRWGQVGHFGCFFGRVLAAAGDGFGALMSLDRRAFLETRALASFDDVGVPAVESVCLVEAVLRGTPGRRRARP